MYYSYSYSDLTEATLGPSNLHKHATCQSLDVELRSMGKNDYIFQMEGQGEMSNM